MLNLWVQDYSDAHVIHLTGVLDALTSIDLYRMLDEQLLLNKLFIVLDLTGVNKLTSTAQRVILDAYLKSRTSQVSYAVVLCGMSDDIEALIRITGMTRLVLVYPSLDTALWAIKST